MIGFKFSEAKKNFFDKAGVEKVFTKAERKVYNQFGGFTRKTARNSMRKVGKRAKKLILSLVEKLRSPAAHFNRGYRAHLQAQLEQARQATSSPRGKPPHAIIGLIKRLLVYAVDPAHRSVVIGPTPSNKPTGAPRTLEEGGGAVIGRGRGRRRVRIAKRPYMQPAFKMAKSRLPGMWKNSIRK